MPYNLCLHPPCFHKQFPRHSTVLVRPRSVSLLSQCGFTGSNQTPSFNASYSCLVANFLQQVVLACLGSIFLTSCGQTNLMSTFSCPSNIKVCSCGSCGTGLAHDGFCRSSHLPPRLDLEDLLPPRLLLFAFPSSHPHTGRPTGRGHGVKLFSTSKLFTSMRDESETDSFLPAAAICSISAFLWPRRRRLHLPALSRERSPSSTTSSLQSSCSSSGRRLSS